MSLTEYKSTDAGAPVINGTAASLINWIDTVCVGSGTAYGSKPKQGWVKLFSGTSKAVYQTADGIGHYRVVHDGAQGAAGLREAIVRGCESASGVDTIVDAWPLVSLVADAACVWRLSNTADSTARPWQALVDGNTVRLIVQYNTSQADHYVMGAYDPVDSGNAWNHMLTVRQSANDSTDGLCLQIGSNNPAASMTSRLWAMRTPDGAVKSPRATVISPATLTNTLSGYSATQLPPLPNSAGNIVLDPFEISVNGQQAATSLLLELAGTLPNVWIPRHAGYSGAARGDVFRDSAYNPAAQFSLTGAWNQTSGRVAWETTDTYVSPYV